MTLPDLLLVALFLTLFWSHGFDFTVIGPPSDGADSNQNREEE